MYRRKIDHLEEALNDPEIRPEASDILRSVIDRIEVEPVDRTPTPNSSGGTPAKAHRTLPTPES